MQERRRGRTTPANSTAALVGWAGFGRGPRREVAAQLRKEMLFSFYSSTTSHKDAILNKYKAFSRLDPGMKVIAHFMLYNFAKRSKVKIHIDFDL
jgi:hypothetical protein